MGKEAAGEACMGVGVGAEFICSSQLVGGNDNVKIFKLFNHLELTIMMYAHTCPHVNHPVNKHNKFRIQLPIWSTSDILESMGCISTMYLVGK